jgi:tryptophanase
MIDYLDIATRCAADMFPSPGAYSLLGLSGRALRRFLDGLSDAAAQDLQEAIDNARRVGQLYVAGTQTEMFRRAA